MWVIVRVVHGDVDKIHIETVDDEKLTDRVESLVEMTMEMEYSLVEETPITTEINQVYWWAVFEADDGDILISIDAKKI